MMEMLIISAINFHVANTGFFGTLDEVKFDSSSFCARKMKTIPFVSTLMPKFPGLHGHVCVVVYIM